jgi:peroxiredoxin
VIDKEGIVRHIFKSQFRPHAHVKDALEALHEMACGRQ